MLTFGWNIILKVKGLRFTWVERISKETSADRLANSVCLNYITTEESVPYGGAIGSISTTIVEV
jgi:hypothetical protein